MKKIALILCLVLVASFVLSGCNNSDSIITLEDREVGKIEIQSGNTGETVEVTEEEVISQIADILSLEFEKGEKSNDSILNVSLLYNSLPEEQQLAISAVPPDLLEESGLVKTEDAEVSAQEDELCGYPLAPEEVE